MFPFGFGLSYSRFEYSKVNLSSTQLNKNGKITAECSIINTGRYDAKEAVQLYVRDLVATLARPVRELKAFQKIDLKVGETKKLQFEISPDQLGFWHNDNTYYAELGEFEVWISKDSQSGESVKFELERLTKLKYWLKNDYPKLI
ncbi:MAG: fibronectin type III-like domain-contianing protein [Paludibacter sp.]|nr:fibronectin type III-like domain-contianing protein [Paludibacter sp.]